MLDVCACVVSTDCLQAPHTADKKIVVLPQEITRDDVRIIMWNIMDIYGATQTEKSLVTRSTVNMFSMINEVSMELSTYTSYRLLVTLLCYRHDCLILLLSLLCVAVTAVAGSSTITVTACLTAMLLSQLLLRVAAQEPEPAAGGNHRLQGRCTHTSNAARERAAGAPGDRHTAAAHHTATRTLPTPAGEGAAAKAAADL